MDRAHKPVAGVMEVERFTVVHMSHENGVQKKAMEVNGKDHAVPKPTIHCIMGASIEKSLHSWVNGMEG